MPEMDGFELVSRLKENQRFDSLKKVMLSSAAVRGQAARCREMGIHAYLTKPVTPHELKEALQSVLGKPEKAASEKAAPDLVTRHTLHEQTLSLKILVAEDNAVNQKLITLLLSKRGHEVTIANNGQEALNWHGQSAFDLILMDMQMPVMGGLEATQRIREQEVRAPAARKIPIYALTAAALPEEREAGLQAGLDGYLTKPIVTKELQDLLQQIASRRENRQNGEGVLNG